MPAESGHGVVLYVFGLAGAPTVWTPIDELTGDITFKITHASKETTPHSRGGSPVLVDEYVFSNKFNRDEMTLNLNYDSTNEDHEDLYDLAISGTFIGLAKVGPGGVLHGEGSIHMSGELSSAEQTDPQFEGQRVLNFMFRPSGPFRRNGVLYS
jgi:hypothetical protein